MRRVLLSLASCFIALASLAQSSDLQVINAAGGSYSAAGSYFRLDWSVGEMALVQTAEAPGKILFITNGFLQPYINGIDVDNDTRFSADEVKVFPNPANSYVEINFRTSQRGRVSYELYNALGQKVYGSSFTSNGLDHIERINTGILASGMYILRIDLVPDAGYTQKKGEYKLIKVL